MLLSGTGLSKKKKRIDRKGKKRNNDDGLLNIPRCTQILPVSYD